MDTEDEQKVIGMLLLRDSLKAGFHKQWNQSGDMSRNSATLQPNENWSHKLNGIGVAIIRIFFIFF